MYSLTFFESFLLYCICLLRFKLSKPYRLHSTYTCYAVLRALSTFSSTSHSSRAYLARLFNTSSFSPVFSALVSIIHGNIIHWLPPSSLLRLSEASSPADTPFSSQVYIPSLPFAGICGDFFINKMSYRRTKSDLRECALFIVANMLQDVPEFIILCRETNVMNELLAEFEKTFSLDKSHESDSFARTLLLTSFEQTQDIKKNPQDSATNNTLVTNPDNHSATDTTNPPNSVEYTEEDPLEFNKIDTICLLHCVYAFIRAPYPFLIPTYLAHVIPILAKILKQEVDLLPQLGLFFFYVLIYYSYIFFCFLLYIYAY